MVYLRILWIAYVDEFVNMCISFWSVAFEYELRNTQSGDGAISLWSFTNVPGCMHEGFASDLLFPPTKQIY